MLTSAFHTFGATGIREDLTELISMISPTDTPVYEAMGTVKATNTLHEHQTDTLASAATNAALEGDIFTNLVATRTPTDRLSNRTQIFTKGFTITDTQEIVNKAGRGKESAYQLMKAGKEIKNDFEYRIFDYDGSATGVAGNTTRARQMRTLHSWIADVTACTGFSGVGGTLVTGLTRAGVLSASSTGATIAESTFNLIHQNIWNQGGRPNAVYVGGSLGRLLAGWATSTSRVWDGSKKVTNAIQVYESMFGILEVKLERHCASSFGYLVDESLWKKAVLKPIGVKSLASRGLGDDYLLWSEWTIEARNPSGNGMFISTA